MGGVRVHGQWGPSAAGRKLFFGCEVLGPIGSLLHHNCASSFIVLAMIFILNMMSQVTYNTEMYSHCFLSTY